jgi:hypothetical protein
MAIEMNTRTKILAGVVALAAAGAASWFLFLEEFLQEPPPKPVPVAAKAASAPKPAASAAGAAKDAAKSEAPKAGEPGKSDAPKAAVADAGKAAPAKPAAPQKPVPTDPAELVAAIIEETGISAAIGQLAGGMKQYNNLKDPNAAKDLDAALDAIWEPKGMRAAVANGLRASYDSNRMPRYLDLIRQPVVQKMRGIEATQSPMSPAAIKEAAAYAEKNPPAEPRAKLIARIEQIFRPMSGVDGSLETAFIDGMLPELQSEKRAAPILTQMGGGNARNARASQMAAIEAGRGKRIRDALANAVFVYRSASDAELAEYVKLLDTEIGEWGVGTLGGAFLQEARKRTRETGRAMGKIILASMPSKPQQQKAEAPAEKPEDKLATAAPAAKPAPEPVYQRPANMREAYTRYNDLVTATVMRDRAAVKELLDAGKYPNVRQGDGLTPLMIAASNGDIEIASMLLAKGADPNLRSPGGNTAMRLARARNNAEMLRTLERGGGRI